MEENSITPIVSSFVLYVNDLYNFYKTHIPEKNEQGRHRAELLNIFKSNATAHKSINKMRYLIHFNLRNAAVWLKDKVFKDLNIHLDADIDINNLNDYVNGDLINFNIRVVDIDSKSHFWLSGVTITYLMNIQTVVDEILNGLDENTTFIKIEKIAEKYNAFIYLNNIGGDLL